MSPDDIETLYAALIRHGDFQEDDCDSHEEFDCREDVYATVRQIVARHVEAFREQAVAAIEAAQSPGHRFLHGVPDDLPTHYEHAAQIVRDLPR